MKKALWIGAAAVLAFAVILVARLPARWAAGFLPAGVTCIQLNGTVWRGRCTGLAVNGRSAGDLGWQLRPTQLLRGKIAARLDLSHPQGFVKADVEADSSRNVLAENLKAQLPLDPSLIPHLPPGIGGSVQLDLPMLRVEQGIVTAIQGRIETNDLHQSRNPPLPLGDYSLMFPPGQPGAEPVGQLQSLRGPLTVNGTLRLTRAPGVAIEGTVAARADAPEPLRRQLEYLGSPDAQGRRPFSLDFSF
jgi:general secretion pathway protein N